MRSSVSDPHSLETETPLGGPVLSAPGSSRRPPCLQGGPPVLRLGPCNLAGPSWPDPHSPSLYLPLGGRILPSNNMFPRVFVSLKKVLRTLKESGESR